ncbi:hypothetical protein OPV22_029612 [Ensete ventricosum]|uniref:Uncharacterized protein n=1 Tax=Ensete ventricosum TaxID=4639 RepID=A0AAV8QDU5_ENSVE|nr:hypothetical protein OPV22_029612 [Ensete ventricosum]
MCRSPFVARAARGLLISPKPTSTVVSLTDLGSLQKAKHRKGGTGWVQKENGTASGQGLLQSYFQFLSVSRLVCSSLSLSSFRNSLSAPSAHPPIASPDSRAWGLDRLRGGDRDVHEEAE